jgi:hypothetical protein
MKNRDKIYTLTVNDTVDRVILELWVPKLLKLSTFVSA